MSKAKSNIATPLKPNQVRVHTNSNGGRSYYVVVEYSNELGALWFRSNMEKPLHLSMKFEPQETDEVIMDNIGIVRDTFLRLDPEYSTDK